MLPLAYWEFCLLKLWCDKVQVKNSETVGNLHLHCRHHFSCVDEFAKEANSPIEENSGCESFNQVWVSDCFATDRFRWQRRNRIVGTLRIQFAYIDHAPI